MALQVPEQLISRLKEMESRFERVTDELGVQEIIADRIRFSDLSKEHSSLIPIVGAYRSFDQRYKNYLGSMEVLQYEKDPELSEMAKADVQELEPILEKEIEELQVMLLPKDPRDEKNAVLEVRAGVGGDEAGLFCSDLYRAYVRYAEGRGWKVEPLSWAEMNSSNLPFITSEIL